MSIDLTEVASAASGIELAQAFGWRTSQLRSREIAYAGAELAVARADLGGEPAVLFAKTIVRNGHDPIEAAALYAYHTAVNWGVLADDIGLTVFNAHWTANNSWFRLPPIKWNALQESREYIKALGPEEMVSLTIEQLTVRRFAPSSVLVPIDDELVDRLDWWRDEALKFAQVSDGIDDHLQKLYAQFFVLRTVEDRRLDPKVASLWGARIDDQRINRSYLVSLFEAARQHVCRELFDVDVAAHIPDHVVAGIIVDLYIPRAIPWKPVRYDFAWLEADILGVAYEKYLATVLVPTPPQSQLDIFRQASRDVARINVRKRGGVYYTPKFIRDFLATRCVDEYFNHAEQNALPRVIDFSCGSGSFLVAAADRILSYVKQIDPKRRWARELVDGGFLVGIDVDPRAVTAARLHLWQRLLEETDALPLPTLSNVIIVADGLRRETWGDLNRSYDIVLGNPPFLATSFVEDRQQLEVRFSVARGRYDFAYLFIEQAVNVVAGGGHIGMVVPNRLYTNRHAAPLRELLVREVSLLAVVDFGSTKPFNASAYIGCLVCRKLDSGEQHGEWTRVIKVLDLQPEFMAANLLLGAVNGSNIQTDAVYSYVAKHPTSGLAWPLLTEQEQLARIQVEEISVQLGTLALIPQGIRTGGNDLFIFDQLSVEGTGLCMVVNGLGDTTLLEEELLERVVFGSEVKRYQRANSERRLLYPYRRNRPLSEGELQEKFPQIWAYLLRNRSLLAARGSLKKSGGRFYELIWPRDESWLRRPKLLIRDLAPRPAFAIDEDGSTFLVGGTAVVPEQSDMLLAFLGYLNSETVFNFVRRTTPQFRGEYLKFEPQHLERIPVLRRLLEDTRFAGEIGDLARTITSLGGEAGPDHSVIYEERIEAKIIDALKEQGINLGV